MSSFVLIIVKKVKLPDSNFAKYSEKKGVKQVAFSKAAKPRKNYIFKVHPVSSLDYTRISGVQSSRLSTFYA